MQLFIKIKNYVIKSVYTKQEMCCINVIRINKRRKKIMYVHVTTQLSHTTTPVSTYSDEIQHTLEMLLISLF